VKEQTALFKGSAHFFGVQCEIYCWENPIFDPKTGVFVNKLSFSNNLFRTVHKKVRTTLKKCGSHFHSFQKE